MDNDEEIFMFRKLRVYIRNHVFHQKEMKPGRAYDLWSSNYDNQSHNLVLRMDERIFKSFIDRIQVSEKIVVDIGCGTGRHWQKILSKNPGRLIGYDVSKGMLHELALKFPEQETHLLKDHRLYATHDRSCDLIVSTLTIAHIPDLQLAFAEWDRVLKPGADVIISDFHPAALAGGGKRMFSWNNMPIVIESHIYTIDKVKRLANGVGWSLCREEEGKIDNSVKDHFIRQQALDSFERNKGMLLIYGIQFKKGNATG